MALAAGTRLGPYQITAPLGAGGMGEVYRARDTRLDRTVAIKILPQHLSHDVVRKQRFEREAKTISSLNHPHICVLHDIGHQDGIDYLVMECVEGDTLAKRLEKGPLPLDQVLKYGAQIADALDKAHRNGVVHRDLKPGNIVLSATGAKLLDFGLAKPSSQIGTAATLTEAAPVTEEGTVVGTFQYMSPEQLEGRDLDGRSDIFSLGTVLYEMVTGRKAFEGQSKLSVASAILEKEPAPIQSIKPLAPRALDHAIRRCLTKDKEERWQTGRDLASELSWISEGGAETTVKTSTGDEQGRGTRVLMWSALSLLLAGIAGAAGWMLKPQSPQPVSRTVINLPAGQRLAGLNETAVALSDDGTQVAYVGVEGNTQRIYLRSMDNLQPRAIPGTEGGINPFFSPDGQWLGFFADQKLRKVSLRSGGVVALSDAVSPHGASWGSDGTIAYSSIQVAPLQKVPESGGAPEALTHLAKDEVSHREPEFLPDGKSVLFAVGRSSFYWGGPTRVAVQSLRTGERKDLIKGASFARYASSGHLVYAQGGNLLAVPFDTQRLAVTGAPTPVMEGVLQSRITGAAQYSISRTGSLAYVPGGIQADQRKLVWVSRNGKEQLVSAPERPYLFPRLSPNGREIAVGITGDETQIWLYDFARGTLSRLTFVSDQNQNPVWSPDGKRLAFLSRSAKSTNDIDVQRSDGSLEPDVLTTTEHTLVPTSWSPDGQVLACLDINAEKGYDLWVLPVNERKAHPFLQTPFNESAPRFSPDGHWLAYISNESGRYEIYVQAYPGPGAKLQVSTEGGTEPVWNPNGRELFYRSGNKMMVVDVALHTALTAGKPRILFEGSFVPTPATSPNYDVSPDGQRFLMVKASETAAAPNQINVVLNWVEELKRLPQEKR